MKKVTIEFETELQRAGERRLVAVGIIGPGVRKIRVSQEWHERQSLIQVDGCEVKSA